MSIAQSSVLQLPEATLYANDYIKYYPGTLNIILSIPHGGRLKPDNIPNRDAGTCINGKVVYDHRHREKDHANHSVKTKSDVYTIELSLMVAQELLELTKQSPYIVINQLCRAKLDANRSLEMAAFGVEEAKTAWYKYHECIDNAKRCIRGPGLFLDIHGQSHPEEWIELGYTLTPQHLDDGNYNSSMTSLRGVAERKMVDIHELICGEESLGAYLEDEDYATVPSPKYPGPKGRNYYPGGYNTERHGSKQSGFIDGIQIECPRSLRDKSTAPKFSKALARAIYRFWKMYYQHTDDVV